MGLGSPASRSSDPWLAVYPSLFLKRQRLRVEEMAELVKCVSLASMRT